MAKTTVTVELSPAQEIALLNRYGRRCSPETLVKRAIDEVLKQQDAGIDVFISLADHQAKVKAELDALEAERRAKFAAIPPAALELLERFKAGERFTDLENREVSALELNDDLDTKVDLPLLAQFGGDDSESYPVSLKEIVPEQKATTL